jgi:pimeloyl-ACP methyl ester carboxylesterase
MIHQTIPLTDDRVLGFALYGPVQGRPVLYFHGTPSSRLEPCLLEVYGVNLDALLLKANIRLIAVDRPGMGLSTFNRHGNFLSFTKDVRQLLHYMHIDQCDVLCWSGGGPYALAMAHQYPQMIGKVSIICGFTRTFAQDVLDQMGMNKWYFHFAIHTPWLLKSALRLLSRQTIHTIPPQWITGLPYVDYRMLNTLPRFRSLARYTMKEACSNGAKGPVHEARSYFGDFGFDVSAIRQPVHYWWGTSDMTVIRLHAEAIENKAQHPVMHFREKEGHLSLYVNCMQEIIGTH